MVNVPVYLLQIGALLVLAMQNSARGARTRPRTNTYAIDGEYYTGINKATFSTKCKGDLMLIKNDTEEEFCVAVATHKNENRKISLDACECEYSTEFSGCYLKTLPPQKMACNCTMTNSRCTGEVVSCKDSSSRKCNHPDLTKEACEQGGGNCNGYKCSCVKEANGGCKIEKAAPAGTACKCEAADDGCTATVVECKFPGFRSCKAPSIDKGSCEQAEGGDCGGYYCECDYNDPGCTIVLPAPKNKACRCEKTGQNCTATIVPCRNANNKACKNPDHTFDSCKEGNGDCSGYECKCKMQPNRGCIIEQAAPFGNACNCTIDAGVCKGEIVDCRDKNHESCLYPDKGKMHCQQGQGNCDGYHCYCRMHGDGCYLEEPAPEGKACECIPDEDDLTKTKCTSKIVDCPEGKTCASPDVSKESCDIAPNGNCIGYSCECEFVANNGNSGCRIKSRAPNNNACKCTKKPDEDKCEGTVVDCQSPTYDSCENPGIDLHDCQQAKDGNCNGYEEKGEEEPNLDTCECLFHKGTGETGFRGCYIGVAAAKNSACVCELSGETCSSQEVQCDQTNEMCSNPSIYKNSCEFAGSGADCGGYGCECTPEGEGCKISLPAPKNHACKCTKENAVCRGEAVACKDSESQYCQSPGTTIKHCEQANDGNCAGYTGNNTTVSPGNTTVIIENTTVSSGNTTVSIENTTVSSGNTTVSPGNTTVSSGNTTVSIEKTTVSSGNTTVSPGNTTFNIENITEDLGVLY